MRAKRSRTPPRMPHYMEPEEWRLLHGRPRVARPDPPPAPRPTLEPSATAILRETFRWLAETATHYHREGNAEMARAMCAVAFELGSRSEALVLQNDLPFRRDGRRLAEIGRRHAGAPAPNPELVADRAHVFRVEARNRLVDTALDQIFAADARAGQEARS
jgi:hypothetical protein